MSLSSNKNFIKVAFFPNHWRDNPYLELLEKNLRDINVQVDKTTIPRPFIWWLKKNRGTVDILHFHWLNEIYVRETYLSSLIALIKFYIQLQYAKFLKYKIVWTMHNLYPHERRYPRIDFAARKLVLRFADAVVVHCCQAKHLLNEHFDGHHSIFVAPLGSYIGVYPDTVSKFEARNRLEIKNSATLYLYHGSIRAYKGLENLMKVFQGLSNPDAILLIAGKLHKALADQKNALTQASMEDHRIIFHQKWIPDDELQNYFRAADVVVYPFESVLTSSSVILAMSFGRPVIAPSLGCLPELISEDVGFLYDPSIQGGLKEALLQCQSKDLTELGKNAFEMVNSLTWRDTAEVTRLAYIKILQ